MPHRAGRLNLTVIPGTAAADLARLLAAAARPTVKHYLGVSAVSMSPLPTILHTPCNSATTNITSTALKMNESHTEDIENHWRHLSILATLVAPQAVNLGILRTPLPTMWVKELIYPAKS
jgi:hypothetical protein